jgi:CheY-like chemotaxis protein
MSLILAIEPNKRQAQQLASLVKQYLKGAELVAAAAAPAALKALGDRIPDLVLTPALLASKDEAALTERLRSLGPAGSHVQTLAVPILAATPVRSGTTGGLLGLRREPNAGVEPVGCAPDAFADQIKIYLERAAAERAAHVQSAAPGESVPRPEAPAESADIDIALDDILADLWLPETPATAPQPAADEPADASSAVDSGSPSSIGVVAGDDVRVLEARPVEERAPRRPTGYVRAMENELGLLRSATAAPALWRVAEGLDDAPPFEPEPEAVEPVAVAETPVVVEQAPVVVAVEAPPAVVVVAAQPPLAAPAPAPPKANGRSPKASRPAPPVDDWAYFDPSQSAFKALVRRLDEIAGGVSAP